MRSWLAVLLLAASVVHAQEGFPLDGTWRGVRRVTGEPPVTIVLVMQWDGHKVSGIINPGPKAIPIGEAQLVPQTWHVTLSARAPGGEPISFQGVLGELGSYNRSMTGTWTEGGHSYPVRIVRE
jgi:hypothetical protein